MRGRGAHKAKRGDNEEEEEEENEWMWKCESGGGREGRWKKLMYSKQRDMELLIFVCES